MDAHPAWWAAAADLRPGDRLHTPDGWAEVDEVVPRPGTDRVYNLTVEDEHLFRVGRNATLVHNMECDTPHTISESRPGVEGEPNSIHEQVRSDGGRSVTYYDEYGRSFSREDYGQLRPHKNAVLGPDGRAIPHEHLTEFSEFGPVGKKYRLLDESGRPISEWWDD